MSLAALPEQVLSWLATFAIHSTLLLTLALFAQRWLRRRSLRLAEQVIKIALCGGLLTATLQLALGYTPLGGKVPIEHEVLPTPAFFDEGPMGPGRQEGPEIVIALAGRPAVTTVSIGRPESPAFAWPARPALPLHALGALLRGQPLSRVLLLIWGVGALALLLRTGARFAALFRRLAGRRRVIDGPAADALTDLCAQAGVQAVTLSASPHLQVPIARGLLIQEICLPARALDLPEEQLRGILAHELAHLIRRDPVWLAALAVLEGALFFQPLLRLCRVRLQEISEYLCDDFSVEHTGEGLALARCLTEVAGWVLGEREAALVPGMASGVLSQRVQRLLSLHPQGRGLPPRGALPLCVAVLFAIAACAPSISTARRALAVKDAEAAQAERDEDQDNDNDNDNDHDHDHDVVVNIDVPRPPRPPRPPIPPRIRHRVRVHENPAEHAEQERVLRQELTREKERFLKELPTQQQLAKIKEKAQALARAIEEQKEEELERLEEELEALTEGLRPNEEAMSRMQHLAQRLAHVATRRAHAERAAREEQAAREERREGRIDDEERQRLDEERRRIHEERKRLEEERKRLEEERKRLGEAQKQVTAK